MQKVVGSSPIIRLPLLIIVSLSVALAACGEKDTIRPEGAERWS